MFRNSYFNRPDKLFESRRERMEREQDEREANEKKETDLMEKEDKNQ